MRTISHLKQHFSNIIKFFSLSLHIYTTIKTSFQFTATRIKDKTEIHMKRCSLETTVCHPCIHPWILLPLPPPRNIIQRIYPDTNTQQKNHPICKSVASGWKYTSFSMCPIRSLCWCQCFRYGCDDHVRSLHGQM